MRKHLCSGEDRKSTRLNSSHMSTSYAVFCLKKTTTRPAASSPAARAGPRAARSGALPGRQLHDEHRAALRPVLRVQPAAVLADDAVGDRQAEAAALARRLGREERIEDAA